MKKRSAPLFSAGSTSVEDIKFTGLRPSWDVFWEVEATHLPRQCRDTSPTAPGRSDREASITISTTRSGSGVRNVKFVTGSEWTGEWDSLGMCGMGIFRMPHGVIYEGTMNGGLFEGIGCLRYPTGGVVEGFWHEGKLKYCQYNYADNLKRESPVDWAYCRMPDRRFYSEMQSGLRAADTEQVSMEDPPLELPPGMYDAGDGFYSPKTKCVTDRRTGDVLRIPTVEQEQWILNNCRVGVGDGRPGVVGLRPDLYENWYRGDWEPEHSSLSSNSQMEGSHKELQELLLQRGCGFGSDVDGMSTVGEASGSSTVPNVMEFFSMHDMRSASSIWSRSTINLELFMKRFFNYSEERKRRTETGRLLDVSDNYEREQGDSDEALLRNEIYSYLRLSDTISKPKSDEEVISEQSRETLISRPRTGSSRDVLHKSSFSMGRHVLSRTLSAEVLENVSEKRLSRRPSADDLAEAGMNNYSDDY